jgi:hypothetical protein
MSFRKYDHVERFGTDEVEGIEIGDVLIFPKLDGTNASVWALSVHEGCVDSIHAGSRNRELSLDNDNAGFCKWATEDERIEKLLFEKPCWILYGEWMVPHTLKTYRPDTWNRFWIFDVYCRDRDRYVHYDEYAPLLLAYNLDVIEPKSRYLTPPSYEQLLREVATNEYLLQDGHVGEGIVIKNYEWRNQYGRQPWAKLVRNEFKEENKRAFGTTEKIGEWAIEGVIAEKYVTKALVDKTYAKIKLEVLDHLEKTGVLRDSRAHMIPRLLQTVYYDLVREECWNFVKEYKNPTVNFKKLQQFTVYWVKKHKPELF